MGIIHGHYPWALSMGIIHGHYPWALSMGIIRGQYPWAISMGIIHGQYPWALSMGITHGQYPWALSMGSIRSSTCPAGGTQSHPPTSDVYPPWTAATSSKLYALQCQIQYL